MRDSKLSETSKFILGESGPEHNLSTDIMKRTNYIKNYEDSRIVILDDKKYELLPKDKVPVFFGLQLLTKKDEILDDDYVYRIDTKTGDLVYKEPFELPDSLDDLDNDTFDLVISNYMGGLVPYKEKKLNKQTIPRPLYKSILYRLGIGAAALVFATIMYLVSFTTWHIFPLAGIYSLIYFINAGLVFYYAKTRNFKMFSGIVTHIETSLGWSKSLRRTYIQLSNGKKFLAFQYNLGRGSKIKEGTPATVFMPNNTPIVEGPLGPTAQYIFAVSFSIDVKSADKYGEYQDGRMHDRSAEDYFSDTN